jgi:hypothetical protein
MVSHEPLEITYKGKGEGLKTRLTRVVGREKAMQPQNMHKDKNFSPNVICVMT